MSKGIQIRLLNITCQLCGKQFEARCENANWINCPHCKTKYKVDLTLRMEGVRK